MTLPACSSRELEDVSVVQYHPSNLLVEPQRAMVLFPDF